MQPVKESDIQIVVETRICQTTYRTNFDNRTLCKFHLKPNSYTHNRPGLHEEIPILGRSTVWKAFAANEAPDGLFGRRDKNSLHGSSQPQTSYKSLGATQPYSLSSPLGPQWAYQTHVSKDAKRIDALGKQTMELRPR
jgi:hypothetical protein